MTWEEGDWEECMLCGDAFVIDDETCNHNCLEQQGPVCDLCGHSCGCDDQCHDSGKEAKRESKLSEVPKLPDADG